MQPTTMYANTNNTTTNKNNLIKQLGILCLLRLIFSLLPCSESLAKTDALKQRRKNDEDETQILLTRPDRFPFHSIQTWSVQLHPDAEFPPNFRRTHRAIWGYTQNVKYGMYLQSLNASQPTKILMSFCLFYVRKWELSIGMPTIHSLAIRLSLCRFNFHMLVTNIFRSMD